MEMSEHLYAYDPYDGHPDKITNGDGYYYFFMGNGHIEVAIQYNRSHKGSPYALILMDPTQFGKKSEAFNYDEKHGFERTMLEIRINGKSYLPDCDNVKAKWDFEKEIPTVHIEWNADCIKVIEEFYCPDNHTPMVLRNITLKNESQKRIQGELYIDLNIGEKIDYNKRKFQFTILPDNEKKLLFGYSIDPKLRNIFVELIEKAVIISAYEKYWSGTNKANFNNDIFNFLYNTAKYQVASTLADNGMLDACIWQYNLEWVRDLSNITLGMILSGQPDRAKNALTRMLTNLVDTDGGTIDSSRKRPMAEIELDQNGVLLYALWTYYNWTDDFSIIKDNWEKIKALAEFPIMDIFRDKNSGLLKNCREYWERHSVHGVTTGYELTYQFFPIIGLEKASEFAVEMGEKELSKKWKNVCDELKKAFLTHPKYAMIHDGHFIKRRKENGAVHEFMQPPDKNVLPDRVPLKIETLNYLEPDSCEVLPIAYELIDPKSELATKTLQQMEKLWNERWNNGGYGRYNASSEPDAPGPWPFATVFIARAYLENENQEKVMRALQWLYDKSRFTGSWQEVYTWRPCPPLPPLSIIPWAWGELVVFFIHHLIGLRPLKDKIIIRPKILDLTNKIEGKFTVKNTTFRLVIQKKKDISSSHAVVNKVEKILFKGDGVIIPFSAHIKEISIYLK